MSASTYKRATKKYAARVDHTDGDTSEGFVLVPVGADFVTTITQAGSFLNFETSDGEETYLSLQSVKRITELVDATSKRRRAEEEDARARAEEKAKADAETARKASGQQSKADPRDKEKRTSPFSTNDEFEALDVMGLGEYATMDEIQGTYRRLVKLYHPDRLRGLGVSDKKIAYAAERLAEINNAYKLLAKKMKQAA
jgi:DnaJ-domain-containing protein 1